MSITHKTEKRACYTAAHDFALRLRSRGAFQIYIKRADPGFVVSWAEKTARPNLRAILHDPQSRQRLMCGVIVATQAREGIETTPEQAQAAYKKIRNE